MTLPADHPELWADYLRDRSDVGRNRLVEAYLPLVGRAASRVRSQWQGLRLDHDDFAAAGCVGLIQAVERFDAARGLRVAPYLYHRIRGAILDWLREAGLTARSVRRGRGRKFLSLQSFCDEELGRAAILAVEHGGFRRADDRDEAENLLSRLDRRSAEILRLQFFAGLAVKDLAPRFGLGETRAFQIRRDALAKLRKEVP